MLDKPEDKYISILTGDYCRLDDRFTLTGKTIELDLGCGKGSFSTRLAERCPERLIFAADVMIGRLRKLQKRNARAGIANVRPLRVEAAQLVAMIPDRTLTRLHILCPDPWPKERHRAHRLLSSEFVGQLHRVLKPGGHFHFSTDDPAYYEAVRRIVSGSGLFRKQSKLPAELAAISSDFELRWNEQGKTVRHLLWAAR
ncbi:MAG: methyltransferase domain-containing protein [Victivallaceae bacterium]|nr:methyltransferase domain-containing protein [Victivallaceae bacterium]